MSWIYGPLLPVATAGGLSAEVGSIAVAGGTVVLTVQCRLAVTAGNVAVASPAQTLTPDLHRVAVSWAEVSFGSVKVPAVITAGAGNVVVAGVPVTLSKTYPALTAGTGIIAASGGSVGLGLSRSLTVAAGNVAVAGGTAQLDAQAGGLTAVTGSIVVSGGSAGLTYGLAQARVSWAEVRFPVAPPTITSGAGNIVVTGRSVELQADVGLQVIRGNIVVSGGVANMRQASDYPSGAGKRHPGRTPHVPPHLTTHHDMSDEEFWRIIADRRRKAMVPPAAPIDLVDDEEDVIEMMLLAA